MSEELKNDQMQTCPQCENHCPVDALQCGRGRSYFGVTGGEDDHEHEHGHGHEHGCGGHGRPRVGLSGLLHQCGSFVCHAELQEDELFQALTDEEKATLQALLEKLAASWKERNGGKGFGHDHHHGHEGGKHNHQHEGHDK